MRLQDSVEIMLVEDNPTDGELCIRALQRQGLADHLFWAKDGAEAIDFLCCTGAYAGRDKAAQPKVVFLDLRLPKIDGFGVLLRIRQEEPLRVIPVVVLTSSNEDCDIVAGYRLGANSFVSKPVEFDRYHVAMAEVARYWLRLNRPPYGGLMRAAGENT